MQKADVRRAFSLSPTPRHLEIRLDPPMPKKFAMPVKSTKGGMHSEAAATCAGSFSCPIKKVSAVL